MLDPRVGMKIYDNAWYVQFGLEPEQAAGILAGMGVTFVLAQSKLLPMQDTAIDSEVTPAQRARFATLDDRAFRDALKVRGIAYYASIHFGFDPKFIAAHPDLLPVDQHGQREEKTDWYIALPPDRRENTEHKIGLLEPAVRALMPDGVHLGFIRWPGFWEIWLPDVKRADMPDFCYGRATLNRFCEDARIDLPVDDPMVAARLIAARHGAAWRDWKCAQTVYAVAAVKGRLAAIKTDIEIAINTLPFSTMRWKRYSGKARRGWRRSPMSSKSCPITRSSGATQHGRARSAPTSSAGAVRPLCAPFRAARSISMACTPAVAARSKSRRRNSSPASMASRTARRTAFAFSPSPISSPCAAPPTGRNASPASSRSGDSGAWGYSSDSISVVRRSRPWPSATGRTSWPGGPSRRAAQFRKPNS
jgi:hypothetical protein